MARNLAAAQQHGCDELNPVRRRMSRQTRAHARTAAAATIDHGDARSRLPTRARHPAARAAGRAWRRRSGSSSRPSRSRAERAWQQPTRTTRFVSRSCGCLLLEPICGPERSRSLTPPFPTRGRLDKGDRTPATPPSLRNAALRDPLGTVFGLLFVSVTRSRAGRDEAAQGRRAPKMLRRTARGGARSRVRKPSTTERDE